MAQFTVRSADIGRRLDAFLISAISTVLIIRLQLFLTDYPSLGGRDLHIAHLLYGGLLMMVTIILMLSFLTHRVKVIGAVLGGIGFGFFIDELGKFITRDNNYFFKPTAALIYVIFIAIYLAGQFLLVLRGLTPRENLVNSMEYLKEAGLNELDEAEQRRALEFLKQADPRDPLVKPVRALLQNFRALPTPPPSLPAKVWHALRQFYLRLVAHPWFQTGIIGVFLLLGVVSVITLLGIIFGISGHALTADPGKTVTTVTNRLDTLSITDWISLLSALAAGLLVLAGAVRLPHSRLEAYHQFQRALLVTLFVTQVFVFAQVQFIGSISLAINLLLLVALRVMIQQEEA